ncbi:MAG: DNA-directed RNA polymerase subunit beta' [Actinobacteria bacterium HGW-Actinobacteria-7]|nr:MAG: DNA-directed RNA polymerase subunit beta' [Actinobacteria bacterium HGW-Actinobacteria-7]
MLDVDVNNFDRLRIGLASSEQIRQWSRGEVKKPETINYRTLKPEKDGLFCEKIFGPTKDWECYCGKYKRVRFKGIVCERCGVEVTRAKVRRERMGHIELAAPVSHIWYFKGVPSRMGYLLDIAPKDLEKVLYFASSIITSVNEEDREADIAMLKDELTADIEQLEAEKAEELSEIEAERDRLIAVARGEIEPEEHDDHDDETPVEDRIKKLNKEADRDIKDVDEEYADRRSLLQEAFDAFNKLSVKSLVNDETLYREMKVRYGTYFRGGMGAEAVKDLLAQLDLELLAEELRTTIRDGKGQKRQKAIKRLKVVDSFKKSKNRPQWMILDAVPVIPPDLRPMVQLDGGRFATSDLNDLYRRVINRNNRLKRLLDLGAPEIIVNNEKRMLQEAVDALFDNGRRGRPVTGPGNRPLKSISDMLKGKQGRFRQNLLGKRVDYSGRSVIVVGPELKLHQCGLPKAMALELFKPFVMKRLVDLDHAQNIKAAKRLVDRGKGVVWDVLEEVIADHPVMLNRAPTLHRLGIQAFEPILVEGKAIRIHPLVCTAFNADFDGDQMAVHLPLSTEAQAEARILMLSTNNIKSPAHGRPLTTPTQDMVIGLYYLTAHRDGMPGEGRTFMSADEAVLAYDNRADLDLQAKVNVRLSEDTLVQVKLGQFEEKKAGERIETTVGRITFNRSLPDDHAFINHSIDKKGISRIVEECSVAYPATQMGQILDEIKRLGFHYATRAGLTVSVYDAMIPENKWEILAESDKEVVKIESQYERGLITRDERHRQIVDVWTRATDDVGDAMAEAFDKFNPIYMMAYSGARGNIKQIRQLAGMRGLMANPKGDIIDRPIKANFREGLTVLEYFISTHGARKGLADTALRTADSGYLTRRLVDVAQDVIVREQDCGTDEGATFSVLKSDGNVDHNIVGRCLLEPAVNAETGAIVREAGYYAINDDDVQSLADAGVTQVVARTVMTCRAKHGICQACYGWDLASGRPVDIGTAVGIIAAQSIGEPGTQLTMRTFHTGGVAGEDITHGLPRVTELFEARKPKGLAILAENSGVLSIEDEDKTRKLTIKADDGTEVEYTVSRRMQLLAGVVDGAKVELGQQLSRGSVNPHDLLHLKGPNDTLRYIVDQVQDVYRAQGVDINDKHIEVISRQMLRKVSVTEAGDAGLLPGQLIDRMDFATANEGAIAAGGEPASGHPVLLGITKASLATDSFLSAASFQETTRVLTDAAIAGKEDELLGLKENVIIGKLIPAATGMRRYRDVKLSYRGQSIESESSHEGPLPDWAPEELKEIEALLPVRPEPGALSEADLENVFGDFDLEDATEIDVSAFANMTFDPEAEHVLTAFDEAVEVEELDAAASEAVAISDDLETVTLTDIGVSARWVNKFTEAGVATVSDLKGRSEDDLLALPGIGQKAVEEVRAGLDAHGIQIMA